MANLFGSSLVHSAPWSIGHVVFCLYEQVGFSKLETHGVSRAQVPVELEVLVLLDEQVRLS